MPEMAMIKRRMHPHDARLNMKQGFDLELHDANQTIMIGVDIVENLKQ